MEGYEAAVAEAKDERLNLLMRQTGDFLAQMGILVAKEKNDTEDGEAKTDDGQPKPASSKTYYTAAHAIQEEVKEQPEMLVGGQLKEYQVCFIDHLLNVNITDFSLACWCTMARVFVQQ